MRVHVRLRVHVHAWPMCLRVTPSFTPSFQSYPESAENSGHPLLQAVPPLVPLLHHHFEFARRVGPVLPGQPAVLLVDQLQLSEALVDLPLERLQIQTFLHSNQSPDYQTLIWVSNPDGHIKVYFTSTRTFHSNIKSKKESLVEETPDWFQ